MNLTSLFDDDRAVSPVIGVILMVAITVILAAVIGTFVLGLGDRVSQSTPSASFTFDYTNAANDTLEVSHNGGDTIEPSQLDLSISGANKGNGTDTWANFTASTADVSAGSTATINRANLNATPLATFTGSESLDLSAGSVDVVWTNDNGDSSAVLGSWEGPDA